MKLMVIDGNSIVNRAYYGIRPLSTRDGLYTHAIYGFLTTLQRLLDEEQPEALCVTFDRREPTFRHQADERYKAQRKGMPEELAMQLPYLKQVLSAMNIPQYDLTGYEADDLIGTISRRCEASGWDCVIVTGDKDSLQLITPHTKVKLVSTRMGQTTTKDMTEETFREQYGFAPIHMIDLKALMGDASDNIPGVPGVGEKTAMALVQQYHSVAELYRLLPEIDAKPGVIKKLQEGRESAEHSRYLATIVTDAPLNFTPEDNLRRPFAPELYDLLLKLEFQKLIDRYGLTPHRDTEAAPERTVTVEPLETEQHAQALLARIRDERLLTLQGVAGIFPARSEGDDILVTDAKGREKRLPMLRNQTRGEENLSLADFIAPDGDWIGCFALTAGIGLKELAEKFRAGGDDYSAIMAKLLADRLTEAFAEAVHAFMRREMWGYETGTPPTSEQAVRGQYRGRRMAFGYPASPDHSLKREVFDLLAVEVTTGMRLTENWMIDPGEALCGLMFSDADYFSVGTIGAEQLLDYARRRGMEAETVKKIIPNNV